jgi:hypothetical protein
MPLSELTMALFLLVSSSESKLILDGCWGDDGLKDRLKMDERNLQ